MSDLWIGYWIVAGVWAVVWFIIFCIELSDFNYYKDYRHSFAEDSVKLLKISSFAILLTPIWLLVGLTFGGVWLTRSLLDVWRYDK